MNTSILYATAQQSIGPVGMAAPPGGAQGQQPGLISFLPMILMLLAIFYMFVFRPQQKKQKEQKQMLESVKKGDHVVTSGGIHGIVAAVKENVVSIKVADNVKIDFSKTAIAAVYKKEDAAS